MKSLTLTNTYYANTEDPVKAVEDYCLRDPQTSLYVYEEIGNDVELVNNELNGDQLRREIVIRPHRSTVPALVQVLVGSDAMDYLQKTTYDFSKHEGTLTTEMINPIMKGRIQSTSGFNLRSNAPSAPNAVTYTLNVNIEANIFLVGNRVEKSVASELVKRSPRIEEYYQDKIDEGLAAAAAEDASAAA